MTGSYKIIFREVATNREVAIDLFSHYTCIYGLDSGEGKTEFFETVGSGINDGEIEVESELPFAMATEINFHSILDLAERTIIMVDESLVINDRTIKKANGSKHLIIAIARNMPLKAAYPLKGIYFLKRDGNGWFTVEKDSSLPLSTSAEAFESIITESKEQRSEHELLSRWFDNLIAAGGRDNIERKLRGRSGKILVLADLGNIGGAYYLLRKRCEQNPQIRFYDYQAFEELLLNSPLIKDVYTVGLLESYDFMSLERYYQKMLELCTKGTDLEYRHSRPLAKRILESNAREIFGSDVGRVLLEMTGQKPEKDNEAESQEMNLF